MVEVFKTNIQTPDAAYTLKQHIAGVFPGSDVSFDLDDCDRVLRIESAQVDPERIISILADYGFLSEVLV